MSRYDEDGEDGDGPEYNNAYGLWQANLRRALKGKRGRKVLADLRDALMALPEKRLIERALCTAGEKRLRNAGNDVQRRELGEVIKDQGPGVCAVGAYLWHRKVKSGMDPAEAFDSLPALLDSEAGLTETAVLAKAAGMAYTLAWDLAYRNDETFKGMTPEERHTAFVAWIDRELAEVAP